MPLARCTLQVPLVYLRAGRAGYGSEDAGGAALCRRRDPGLDESSEQQGRFRGGNPLHRVSCIVAFACGDVSLGLWGWRGLSLSFSVFLFLFFPLGTP